MDTDLLIHRLQMLQNRLYDMANDLGNLTDPEIVAVSEEADRLIVQLQKNRMNLCRSRQPIPQWLYLRTRSRRKKSVKSMAHCS